MSTPEQQPHQYSPTPSGGLTGWERPTDASPEASAPTLPPYTPEPAPAATTEWTPDPYASAAFQPTPAPAQAPAPAAYPGYGYPVPMEQPESKMGAVALGLAIGALLITLVLSTIGGMALNEVVQFAGPDFDSETLPAEAEEPWARFGITILLQLIPTALGIGALVVSIVALARPSRTKTMAIIALVVALVAPFISLLTAGIMSAV